MASIILSFVGNQDPFSGDTNQEGSIVSLVKHLVLEKDRNIKQVFLLATDGTIAGAKDTQKWLHSEFNLAIESIELIQVDEALSQDPIDILLVKLMNSRTILQRQNRRMHHHEIGLAIDKIEHVIDKLTQAANIDTLRSFEGMGAKYYFAGLGKCISNPDFRI